MSARHDGTEEEGPSGRTRSRSALTLLDVVNATDKIPLAEKRRCAFELCGDPESTNKEVSLNAAKLDNQVAVQMKSHLRPLIARFADEPEQNKKIVDVIEKSEFGHLVSKAVSTFAKPAHMMSDMIPCGRVRHGSDLLGAKGQYDEEDFADAFAALVLKDFPAGSFGSYFNFGCGLLDNENGNWGSRAGLSLIWPEQIKDVHAPPLYRALQLHINGGKSLPATCQGMVERASPELLKTCM